MQSVSVQALAVYAEHIPNVHSIGTIYILPFHPEELESVKWTSATVLNLPIVTFCSASTTLILASPHMHDVQFKQLVLSIYRLCPVKK